MITKDNLNSVQRRLKTHPTFMTIMTPKINSAAMKLQLQLLSFCLLCMTGKSLCDKNGKNQFFSIAKKHAELNLDPPDGKHHRLSSGSLLLQMCFNTLSLLSHSCKNLFQNTEHKCPETRISIGLTALKENDNIGSQLIEVTVIIMNVNIQSTCEKLCTALPHLSIKDAPLC